MNSDTFKELLDELDGNSLQTLKEKNARYSANGDCLHNFRSGAEIMGCSPAQACWRYMAKHLADLRNKIDANDFSDREDFLEKCQDTINYIRFLWCIGNDSASETEEQILRDAYGNEVCRLNTQPKIPDCGYANVISEDNIRCLGTREEDPCKGPKCAKYY